MSDALTAAMATALPSSVSVSVVSTPNGMGAPPVAKLLVNAFTCDLPGLSTTAPCIRS